MDYWDLLRDNTLPRSSIVEKKVVIYSKITKVDVYHEGRKREKVALIGTMLNYCPL